MKVSELIEFLKTQPQDLQVIYQQFSEHAELQADDIYIGQACLPRGDGWVANKRPDKPFQEYLIFPGN